MPTMIRLTLFVMRLICMPVNFIKKALSVAFVYVNSLDVPLEKRGFLSPSRKLHIMPALLTL